MNIKASLLVVAAATTLLLSSCIKEPEGPGERIGKGFDMITGGLDEYGREYPGSEREAAIRREEERRRSGDTYGRYPEERYRRPDPYASDSYEPKPGEFDSRRDSSGVTDPYYSERDLSEPEYSGNLKNPPPVEESKDWRRY